MASDWDSYLGQPGGLSQLGQQGMTATQWRTMMTQQQSQRDNSYYCTGSMYIPPSVPWAGAPKEEPQPTQEKSMFTEIAKDIKSFVLEYRAVLYFIAAALVIDHVFFKGAFRMRLQGMADTIVAKVEKKVAG